MAIKPKEYAQAIIEAKGMVTIAARRLGCKRQAVYAARSRHKIVADAFDEARAAQTDLTEGQLYKKINEGDTASILFYLKTQAKDRGYVEKVQVEHVVAAELEAMLEIIAGLVDGSTYDRILAGIAGRSAEVTGEAARSLN